MVLKNDNPILTKWVILLIIGLVLTFATSQLPQNHDLIEILATLSAITIGLGLVLSQEKTTLKLDRNTLIIERTLVVNISTKRIDINQIKNLTYQQKVKSDVSFSIGRVRVMGMDATPENWKKYYYHKEILSFNIDGQRIEIGKWKKKFGGDKLAEYLKERITKHNNGYRS